MQKSRKIQPVRRYDFYMISPNKLRSLGIAITVSLATVLMRHATKCQLSYTQQYLTYTYEAPKSQHYCPNVKRARNGEPINRDRRNFEFWPIKNVIPGHVSFFVYRYNNIYQNKWLTTAVFSVFKVFYFYFFIIFFIRLYT